MEKKKKEGGGEGSGKGGGKGWAVFEQKGSGEGEGGGAGGAGHFNMCAETIIATLLVFHKLRTRVILYIVAMVALRPMFYHIIQFWPTPLSL